MSSTRMKSATERAIEYLMRSPRIKPELLADNPGAKTSRLILGKRATNFHGKSQKELSLAAKPPLGWYYGDFYRPWTRIWPAERGYQKDIHHRREYPPLSLLELQRLIDLGYFNANDMIDLTSLCNTKLYKCNPGQRQFGVQLTDEGAAIFQSTINIEVQWASELAIVAIERAGGTITTAYYDPVSLDALVDPEVFFKKGEPIPKRGFPPVDLVEYYSDPKSRGYLANPAHLQKARVELAQKYGYQVKEPEGEVMKLRKDPLQVFLGLEPGWVVNLKDECILKPTDEQLLKYYNPPN